MIKRKFKFLLQTIFLSSLARYQKIILDMILLSFVSVIFLKFNGLAVLDYYFSLFLFIIISYLFGFYNSFYRYFSIYELRKSFISGIITFVIMYFVNLKIYDLKLLELFNLISLLFISGAFYKIIIKELFSFSLEKGNLNCIIFGAGEYGVTIKRAVKNNSFFNILGFVDDDDKKEDKIIDGIKVFKMGKKLNKLIKSNKVEYIIIATEKITSKRKGKIHKFAKENSLKVFKYPIPKNWSNFNLKIAKLKNLNIEDILSRDEIIIDNNLSKDFFDNKTILVTGGAGSIGSEIINQLTYYNPKKIVVLDNNENSVFQLKSKLSEFKFIDFHMTSVLDKKDCDKIFKRYGFDYVFHAAAYKHVPLMELYPIYGLKTNILGTNNIMNLSVDYSIEKFVFVSTDKAVNPSNIMGASKRICELLSRLPKFNNNKTTRFITTRFGNVLGSNGSVVPIFQKQINEGGPITITDKKITRFFMTIPEAAKLVLESSRIGSNNNIYIFDMGKPIKILDLAKNMISLLGYDQNEILINEIGLRPGEKLYEELYYDEEKVIKSDNNSIFISQKREITISTKNKINDLIQNLQDSDNNRDYFIDLIKDILPEYKPNKK